MREIITAFTYPPVGVFKIALGRKVWMAWREGRGGNGPYGYGRTPEDATMDLMVYEDRLAVIEEMTFSPMLVPYGADEDEDAA